MALLVNIEGIDGSGKGTQAARLQTRLQNEGLRTRLVSFPRYSETHFGAKVADFLNGRFGQLDQVNPFLAALLYAGDRFESKPWLHELIAQHDVVIFDRYVPSNMAHQGSKLEGAERSELIAWIDQLEYGIYGLPRVDVSILLDIPPEVSRELIARKPRRDYTEQAADLQEADGEHLVRTRDVYLSLAAAGPQWRCISCLNGDMLRTPDDIAGEIFDMVKPLLPRSPKS